MAYFVFLLITLMASGVKGLWDKDPVPKGYTYIQGDCAGNVIFKTTQEVKFNQCFGMCNKSPVCRMVQYRKAEKLCYLKSEPCDTPTDSANEDMNAYTRTGTYVDETIGIFEEQVTAPAKGELVQTKDSVDHIECARSCRNVLACSMFGHDGATKKCFILDSLKSSGTTLDTSGFGSSKYWTVTL